MATLHYNILKHLCVRLRITTDVSANPLFLLRLIYCNCIIIVLTHLLLRLHVPQLHRKTFQTHPLLRLSVPFPLFPDHHSLSSVLLYSEYGSLSVNSFNVTF